MKVIIPWLFLFCFSTVKSQFNIAYFNEQMPAGSAFAVKENSNFGEYVIPTLYTNSQLVSNNLAFLRIFTTGELSELKTLPNTPSSAYFGWGRGFFKSSNNGFILAGGNSLTNPFVYKLDYNLDIVWSVIENLDTPYYCWGGGELANGDVVLGYTGEGVPWNILEMRRYSSEGQLLSNFNVELDYDFSFPSTFITRDSLIYISFPRFLSNNYRRNYIVCYNAITGEEIWETHQIEDEIALGFTEGFLCISEQDELLMVYVEQAELPWPWIFEAGYEGYVKVTSINPLTGEFLNDFELSALEPNIYINDIEATSDGGFVVLMNTPAVFPTDAIMKVDNNMAPEWRFNYSPSIPLKPGEYGSFLTEIEVTSDDCILAVGTASGANPFEEWYFQYPWVLKVDACGNEVVSDCTLSGLSELSQQQTITIYPNPARDRIFLKGENTIQRAMIYDLQGQLVHDERFSGSLQQTLFIDHLPAGLYVVKAMNNEGEWSSERIMVSGEDAR